MAEFKPATVEKWGGLNLRDDPGEVGLDAAIDLLNVSIEPGRVRTRPGTVAFNAAATAHNNVSLSGYNPLTGSQEMLVTDSSPGVRVYSSAGAYTGTAATFSGGNGWASFAKFGSPSATYVYIANGFDTLWRYDGTSFTQPVPTTSPAPFVEVTPWDNRLVMAGHGNTNSTVAFSDAGAPETWTTSNFVSLTPGDGEIIRGLITWRDMVFVFKNTKFFVFYGVSTDQTGGPIFNYRSVNTGIGSHGYGAVAKGPEGVYFLAHDGVYVTAGGTPTKISGDLDPLFRRESVQFFPYVMGSGVEAIGATSMQWLDGKLYVVCPVDGDTTMVLVYDTTMRQWELWDHPAIQLGTFKTTVGGRKALYLTRQNTTIYRVDRSAEDDDGTPFASHYRTGFIAPGGPTSPSVIREVLMDGTGNVSVAGSTDFGDVGTTTSVALGMSPAIAQGRQMVAQQGRFHSYEFSSTGGQWTVNRATFHLDGKATVGKQP